MKLADEQKVVDNLPTYVCDNPDDMSFRLYHGELNVIMRKLNDVNIKIVEYSSVLAAIGQQVCAIQVCSQPVSSRMTAPPPRPDVGGDSDGTLIDRNTGESLIETTAGIPQPVPGDSESNTDWATINFTCRSIAETGSLFFRQSLKTTWTVISSLLFSHDELPSMPNNSHHLHHIRHHSCDINSSSSNRRISQRYLARLLLVAAVHCQRQKV